MEFINKIPQFWRGFRTCSAHNKTIDLRLNCADRDEMSGLVLGVYHYEDETGTKDGNINTTATEAFNKLHRNRLNDLLKKSGPIPRQGETRVFYDFDQRFNILVVVGLGKDCPGFSEKEQIDEYKETVRMAAGAGVRKLQELHAKSIHIESFGHAESSAEGASMGTWVYQEYKNPEDQM